MARFLGETLLTIVGSAIVWIAAGTVAYVTVALLVLLVTCGLVVSSLRDLARRDMIESLRGWVVLATALALGLLLGVFWPVLPISVAWRRGRERSALRRAAPGVE